MFTELVLKYNLDITREKVLIKHTAIKQYSQIA